MDPVAIIVGLILLVAASWFVVKPFRGKPRAWQTAAGTIRPSTARTAALAALRDLDFDHQMGKISEEDYPGLRAQLVTEAARYMGPDSEEDDRIEAMIRARRSAGKKACPKCGKRFSGNPTFCPHCGTSLGPACPSCGKPVVSGDIFCRSCGSKIGVPAEAAA